jgi:hypothetical protein
MSTAKVRPFFGWIVKAELCLVIVTLCFGCEQVSTQDAGIVDSYSLATVVLNNLTSKDWVAADLFIDNGGQDWYERRNYSDGTKAGTGWVRFENVHLPDSGHEDSFQYTDSSGNKVKSSINVQSNGTNTFDVSDGKDGKMAMASKFESWNPPVANTPGTGDGGSAGGGSSSGTCDSSGCNTSCPPDSMACYYCNAACVSDACGDPDGAAYDRAQAKLLGTTC